MAKRGTSGRPVVLQMRAGRASPVVLDAALRVAAALHRDFESIFVEDDELLTLAALPFAREISMTGRRSRLISQEDVAAQMRAASRAVQREIEERGRALDIRTHFKIVRDAPEHAMREACGRAGFLVLGETVSSSTRRELRNVLAALAGVRGCLLVGSGVRSASGRVVVLIDDPERIDEIMTLAGHFGASVAEEVGVLVVAEALGDRDRLAARLAELLGRERRVAIEPLESADPGLVARGVKRLGGGLLIAAVGGRFITSDATIGQITTALECPLLLLVSGALEPKAA